MSIELVYFATESNGWLENTLRSATSLNVRSGSDRREFLRALSDAVQTSDTVLALGGIADLTAALSKGLGLPLEKVNWDALGLEGEDGVLLPKSALPLLVDGSVYGMIFESGQQCIIAIDNDEQAVERLCSTYVFPYIKASAGGAAEAEQAPAESESAAAAPDESTADISGSEAAYDSADAADTPDGAAEATIDENSAETAEEAPVAGNETAPESEQKIDIFADMTDSDVDIMLAEPKKKRKLPIVISIIAVLAALCVAAYFLYPIVFDSKLSADYYSSVMKQYGKTGDTDKLPEQFKSTYLTRFGALYLINSDVIGTVKVSGLDIDLPMVSGASKADGYYDSHRFDGASSASGTLYTKSAYNENSVNPNLVVYGSGSLFGSLEKLLDSKTAAKVSTITTDSILYGEDKWEIFSVMQLSSTEKFDYTSNFSSLTAEQRASAVKTALSLSKTDFGFKASDFDNVGLSNNFLTLVTDCSGDKSQKLVVVARRAADSVIDDSSSSAGSDEPTSSDPSGEGADSDTTADTTASDAAQQGEQG